MKATEKNLLNWTVTFRTQMQQEFLNRAESGAGHGWSGGAGGSGISSDQHAVRSKHNPKDLTVWKAEENMSKPQFRQWIEAINVRLEAICGWTKADIVLDMVRREDMEITGSVLERCIEKANLWQKNDDLTGDKVRDTVDIEQSEWTFEERSRFLWIELITKLNADMF